MLWSARLVRDEAAMAKAKRRRSTKRLRRVKVSDPAYLKARAVLDAGMHQFNAAGHSRREAEDYIVSQFDGSAEMMLHTVHDRAGVLTLAQALDGLVPKSLEFLIQWAGLARIPTSESPTALDLAEFRERLLRRAEHWKSMAHAAVAERVEETPAQRGLRRQQILDPLLKVAGITSDDAWAERAGTPTDRNTPRDYRSGKTNKLQKETRKALAEALGISPSELPD